MLTGHMKSPGMVRRLIFGSKTMGILVSTENTRLNEEPGGTIHLLLFSRNSIATVWTGAHKHLLNLVDSSTGFLLVVDSALDKTESITRKELPFGDLGGR